MSKEETSKGSKVRPAIKNVRDFHIHTDVEGMCVPLEGSLYPDMYSTIKEENLFPYVELQGENYGFFIKHTVNGVQVYSSLPNAEWRSILNGQKLQLRPKTLEEVKKINNRISVKKPTGTIEICYWPDSYYKERLNAALKLQDKRKEKEKSKSLSSSSNTNEEKDTSMSNGKAKQSSSNSIKQKFLNEALSPENDKSVLEKAAGTAALTKTTFSNIDSLKMSSKKDLQLFENENIQDVFKEFVTKSFDLKCKEQVDTQNYEDELDALIENNSDNEDTPDDKAIEIDQKIKKVEKELMDDLKKKETPIESLLNPSKKDAMDFTEQEEPIQQKKRKEEKKKKQKKSGDEKKKKEKKEKKEEKEEKKEKKEKKEDKEEKKEKKEKKTKKEKKEKKKEKKEDKKNKEKKQKKEDEKKQTDAKKKESKKSKKEKEEKKKPAEKEEEKKPVEKPNKKRKASVGEEPPAKRAKVEGTFDDLLKKSLNV